MVTTIRPHAHTASPVGLAEARHHAENLLSACCRAADDAGTATLLGDDGQVSAEARTQRWLLLDPPVPAGPGDYRAELTHAGPDGRRITRLQVVRTWVGPSVR
jgi:hypothetical protein